MRDDADGTVARNLIAVAALAAATMIGEIAWTRLASVWFLGDTTYLLVTVAVAGLSLGAAVAAARPDGGTKAVRASVHAAWGTAAAVAAWAVLAVAAPLLPSGGPGWLAASLLPTFAVLGWAMTTILASMPERTALVLATDLGGAAAGATLALPLIAWTGGHGAVAWAGALAVVGTAVRVPRPSRRAVGGAAGVVVTIAVVATTGMLAADVAPPWDPPGSTGTLKSLSFELGRGGTWTASQWGTNGRSDVVRRADGAEILYLDGSAGSLIPTPGTRTIWITDPGRFPFEAYAPSSVFVIGGGAGLEVTHALETGATSIVVAEIAGAGVHLAREAWEGDVAAGIALDGRRAVDPFGDARVTWRIDEARSTLASGAATFDLIHASHAVTRTQEIRGLASSENAIYTVEAFQSFLDHLRPGGILAFESYDEASLERLVHTAGAALVRGGWAGTDADALTHLAAYLDTATNPPTPLLIVHREAPALTDVVRVARLAERRGLALLLLPDLLAPPPWDRVAGGAATLADVRALAPDVDLAPTVDDAPFFWSFDVGAPAAVVRTWAVAGLAATLVGLASLATRRKRTHGVATLAHPPARDGWAAGLVAWTLGAAFMLAEMTLLSRATLLLGSPSLALAVTLASLLIGCGLAAWSGRHHRADASAIGRSSLVAAAATLATFLVWPWAAAAVESGSGPLRATVVTTVGLGLGFAVGRPFPALLRWISAERFAVADAVQARLARTWALDGSGMLFGGASALLVAHLTGFQSVAVLAAAGYLAVAWWRPPPDDASTHAAADRRFPANAQQ